MIAQQSKVLKDTNNYNNLEYIQTQINLAQAKKREFERREKNYYKPHFGPEETDELILHEELRKNNQKNYINEQLHLQMQLKASMKQNAFLNERQTDQNNLDIAQRQYIAEEMAIRSKGVEER